MNQTIKTLMAGVIMTTLMCALTTFDLTRGGATAKAASVVLEPRAAAQQSENPVAHILRDGFDVEILVNGVAQEKYPARGRLYVEASKGAEYQLRVRNPLPVRVAVALSVDGVNTIDARRTTPREASKWVIPAYSSVTIGGWQMSSSRARRFYFTTELDSYAAKLGRPTDIGVIAAVFFREQTSTTQIVPPQVSPRDSTGRVESRGGEARLPPASPSESARSNKSTADSSRRESAIISEDEYAATGIGRSVHNDVYRVTLDLAPLPVATLNIRYEYRPELVRLGVLPRPGHETERLRRRERARGFEDNDFCPEP